MSLRLSNPMSAAVWLAFFVPTSLFGGWPDRSFAAAIFLLACAVLIAKPSPWEARTPSGQALKIILLLEFSCIVSYVYSAAFNGIAMGPRDCFGLLRYIFIAGFVVYLIRHFDGHVRTAMEWAMTAAVYYFLLFKAADPQGYVSMMTLCYLLFFSRLRLRFLHSLAALLAVLINGAPLTWMGSLLILSAACAVLIYRTLSRRRVKQAGEQSLVFFTLCLAGLAVGVHARTAAPPPQQTLDLFRDSPILGWGTAESAGISVGLNQYAIWLLQGGVLAAGLILAGLTLCGYRLLRATRANLTHLAGAAAFLASVALSLASAPLLQNFRNVFLTACFIAGMHEASR
jgi:hypothetical protein